MERKNLPVRITCLICSHEICTTSTPSAFSAEELFRLFHNFSKRMNWHASGSGVEAFDFHEDPFPFCKPCEGILAEVTTLTEEADRIQKRIQELTGNAASKILLSLDNTNLDHSLETDEELKEERRKKRRKYSKETESRIVCMQKVNHFRSETIRSYSPYVRISKEDSNAGRIAKATRKNKVPKKQRSSKTKGKENRKKTGESSLTTESKYDNETESSKNELNRRNNWQCSKCHKIFSGRSTLRRHFVFCGGTSVVEKLNDDEYIFEDFQFRKTDNGFECGTCEASYQSQQSMKYHIRKVHSGDLGGSTSMEESLNEGEEDRDEETEESSEFTKSPGRPGKRKRKAGETIVKRKVLGKVRMNILKAYASMFQRAQEKDLSSTNITTTSKRISCQQCGQSFCSNFSLRRHMGKSSCRNGLSGVEDQDD